MSTLKSFNKSSTAFVTVTPQRTGYKYFIFRDTKYPDYQSELVRYHKLPVGKILVMGDLLDNSIGAMVLDTHPKHVYLINYAKNFEEKIFHYRDNVLRVKMCNSDIMVFHHNRITIHDYRENGFFVKTPPNPKSVGDLVRTKTLSRFAYPDGRGHNGKYSLTIANAITRKDILRIGVHEKPIGAIVFSPTGDKIAISDENGSQCFIMESDTGTGLYNCCLNVRGLIISSMMFNKSETYLVSSSSSGMVYIFHLNEPSQIKVPYKLITLPEGKSADASICGVVAVGDAIRLMVAFEHHLYVHYLSAFKGVSKEQGRLFNLQKINDIELVEFPSLLSEGDDAVATVTVTAVASATATTAVPSEPISADAITSALSETSV